MILALLTALVVYCLCVGAVPAAVALTLSAGTGALLFFFGRHEHGGVLVVDVYARRSRFADWNAALKVLGCTALLVLCVLSPSALPPMAAAVLMAALVVCVGGLELHDYLALLSLPAAFLLLSGLALLWDFTTGDAAALLSVPFFRGQLILTAAAQQSARLVMARALGAVSCLYFLSLSTPMPEILGVLRRGRVPGVVIELAILIYRYIFVLLFAYRDMKDAAASRLGYSGLRQSIRTTGAVYGNLLAKSFRRAGACFDAMESRCYDGQIAFLERRKPVTCGAAALFCLLNAGMIAAVISLH